MRTCENCIHGFTIGDKVQCTGPHAWGKLVSLTDSCDDWEGDEE